jgi:hypothetical protein
MKKSGIHRTSHPAVASHPAPVLKLHRVQAAATELGQAAGSLCPQHSLRPPHLKRVQP